jgi:hypothetical protein
MQCLYICTSTKLKGLVVQQKSKGHNRLFEWTLSSNLAKRMTVRCLPSNSSDLEGVRCDDNARGTLTILGQSVTQANKALKFVI